MNWHGNTIALWPGSPPGSGELDIQEQCVERSDNPVLPDRAVTQVREPAITVWQPERSNGVGILLAPGGGYQRIVLDKEGSDIARWLTSLGYTVFLLKYRLPSDGHVRKQDVPLQDAQRAMRLIRSRAVHWGVRPNRIGALGFSAGGHVVAMLATCFQRITYEPVDAADVLTARPDFVMLGYPVISMDAAIAHTGSRTFLIDDREDLVQAYSAEQQVSTGTPPTFLFLAADDATVPARNSLLFHEALLVAGVRAELHVFERGGHGFGLRYPQRGTVQVWPLLAERWLSENGWA